MCVCKCMSIMIKTFNVTDHFLCTWPPLGCSIFIHTKGSSFFSTIQGMLPSHWKNHSLGIWWEIWRSHLRFSSKWQDLAHGRNKLFCRWLWDCLYVFSMQFNDVSVPGNLFGPLTQFEMKIIFIVTFHILKTRPFSGLISIVCILCNTARMLRCQDRWHFKSQNLRYLSV